MWLFTSIGFFSVVAHDEQTLVVRARVREHLENLRRRHLPDLEIVEGLCAYVSRDEWEYVVQRMAAEIDYATFDPSADVQAALQSS